VGRRKLQGGGSGEADSRASMGIDGRCWGVLMSGRGAWFEDGDEDAMASDALGDEVTTCREAMSNGCAEVMRFEVEFASVCLLAVAVGWRSVCAVSSGFMAECVKRAKGLEGHLEGREVAYFDGR
jgi:hypothetical protein